MRTILIAAVAALALAIAAPGTDAQTLTDNSLTVTQIVSGLDTPTQIAFLGTNDFLVLEKNTGKVRRVIDGVLQTSPVLDVAVDNSDERGLLGIALHPGFVTNHFVYLCYTESSTGNDSTGVNPLGIRIYRYQWTGSVLTNGTLIFEFPVEPGVDFHNGGVIAFGPDGKLYAVTGDHDRSGQLQNQPAGPAPDDTGVIVRLNDDGSVPSDNPFFAQGGNLAKYYAYGVRNSFGLTFDPVTGKLWDTENGPDHYDEVNLVEPGFNSGWREIMGPAARSSGSTNNLFAAPGSHYADPQFSWLTTVAPTGLTFLNSTALGAKYENDLFVGDFNNANLYHFTVNSARDALVLSGGLADKVADSSGELSDVILGSGFSGISDLKVGPDGRLYVLSISAGKVWAIAALPVHDLAVVALKAPRTIRLSATTTNRTAKLSVTIQNLSPHSETIADVAMLTNLVHVTVQSLGACPDRVAVLQPPKKLPLILAPQKKLRLTWLVTYDCANDPLATTKDADHSDYRSTVTVNHAALDGNADTNPANDDCPRAPSGSDKGCGGKDPVTKQLGADVLTDVVQKP